jgi:hypothetical protein
MNGISNVLSFDKLKKHALDGDAALRKTINRLSQRFDAKTVDKRSFWEWINPRAEVDRLRAFIDAMRQEELLAARNALDLYAENESLRKYKELAVRGPAAFVTTEEYWRVKKELTETQKKLASVSLALDEQMEAWTAYMKSIPTRPAKTK